MRILIADTDMTLLALVRRTLEAEGHQVRIANTVEALEVAAAEGRLDAAFLDAQLASSTTPTAERISTAGTHIFVTTALSDGHDTIRDLRARLGGADYLRKPFSVLDLPYELERVRGASKRHGPQAGYLLGRMAARGASGPIRGVRPPVERGNRSLMPRVGGPVVFPVAERLAGAWLERFTGTVRIRAETPLGRPLELVNGGFINEKDTSLVEVALQGAELQFVPGAAPDGPSEPDRMRFVQTLWAAVYKPAEVRFAEVQAFEALSVLRPELLSDLVYLVGADTYRVLELADGARALGEVVVEAQTTPLAVSADLLGLHRLGLIRFAPPTTRTMERRRPAPTVRPGGDTVGDDNGTRRRRARPDSSPRRSLSMPRRPSSKSRVRRSSSTKRTAGSGRSNVSDSMRRFGRADAVHRRLVLELERLEGASHAEVLGIPNDADRALVREVGLRMLERYESIAENDRYEERTREMGRKIAVFVKSAVDGWGQEHSRAADDPAMQREQIMFEQGKVLIDAGDFARADRAFTVARDHAMANPKILAGLGWARFHNPARKQDEREIEGRDYLMLAEQFDPRDVEVSWMLCQVLHSMGNNEAALHRGKRILSLDRKHKGAAALVKQLTAAEPDDAD